MKTPSNFNSGIVIITALLFQSCGIGHKCPECPPIAASRGSKKVEKAFFTSRPLPGEDVLYLELSEVDAEIGAEQVEKSKQLFWFQTKGLEKEAATMDTSKVTHLYKLAKAINHSPCNQKLTAISFVYGAFSGVAGYELKLLYRPLILCGVGDSTGSGGERFRHYLPYFGAYYEYVNDTFVPTTEATAYIDNYKNNIRIGSITNNRGHNQSDLLNGDVRSLIYTCQELFAVIKDNPESASIKIWNAVREVDGEPGVIYLKHNLLVSGNNPGVTAEFFGFDGKYADLSHLCPPSCNVNQRLTFRLN